MEPPQPETRLHVVEIVLNEGTPDEMSYVCFARPEWVETIWSGGGLPEWVTLDTVSGALVAVREDSFSTVTQYKRLAVDLDYVVPDPVRPSMR